MAVPRALVVDDGSSGTGVATVRGLARAGFVVGLAGPGGLAGASRAVRAHHPAPSARTDAQALRARVHAVAAGYDVVVPTGDAELVALAGGDRLDGRLLAPGRDAVLAVTDKLEVSRAARAAGLPTPRTFRGDGLEAGRLAPDTEVVVKARRHGERPSPPTRRATWRSVLAEPPGGDVLVQQAVAGPLAAVVLAVGPAGELHAVVQQVADVVHPQGRGNTVRGRTVTPDPSLVEACRALLRELGWWGVAQVELVGGAVVDVNGRPYGSLGLAQAAGVDPVAVAALAMLGRPTTAGPAVAAAGARWSYLGLELRGALRAAAPGARVAAAARALAAAPGCAPALWSARDPGPALVSARRSVRGLRNLRAGG